MQHFYDPIIYYILHILGQTEFSKRGDNVSIYFSAPVYIMLPF